VLDEGKERANVLDFEQCKERRAQQFIDQERDVERPFMVSVDDATRDLHAAARSTMNLVLLARSRLGLPEI
jgi:hypothetical protein